MIVAGILIILYLLYRVIRYQVVQHRASLRLRSLLNSSHHITNPDAKLSRPELMVKQLLKWRLLPKEDVRDLIKQFAGFGGNAKQASLFLIIKCLAYVGVIALPLMAALYQPLAIPLVSYLLIALIGIMLIRRLAANYLERQEKKFHTQVERSLSDVVELMIICYEAGYSHDNVLKRLSQDLQSSYPQMANLLGTAYQNLTHLSNRRLVWEKLADSVTSKPFKQVIQLIKQNDTLGSPMLAGLQTQKQSLRDDRITQAETIAARIPVLMTLPLVLCFFPVLFLMILGPGLLKAFEALA